jgi:Spy/CpxP family protein refolding chaperone
LSGEALVPSGRGEQGASRWGNQKKNCNQSDCVPVIISRSGKVLRKIKMKQTMKRNILTLVTAAAIALGGFVVVQAQPGPGGGHWRGHAFGLKGITEKLDLTADQQTKVQPILDAAKPQLVAIHQEAMQKAKGIIDSSLSQIRPLLNADQQKKLDAIQKAHQDMMNAHKELQDAMQQ